MWRSTGVDQKGGVLPDVNSNRTSIRGRGACRNLPNRFETISYVPDPDYADPEGESVNPRTVFLRDTTRSIVTFNDSPDVGFDVSVNPYRGCEHGCAYCYARPYHEYLGFSAGLDFETKILVKERAPELLRTKLGSRSWTPRPVALSGVTDPYQPVERRLFVTRGCIRTLADFRNPVTIVTKNHLITRDIDILSELARVDAACVMISFSTLNTELARILEPRTSTPSRRLEAVESLAKAGIPTGVFVAPVIPGLTDHEVPSIVENAARAGAGFAACHLVRLPHGVKTVFAEWLDAHLPDRKNKVLNRIRETRGGRLDDTRYCTRTRGEGEFADQIMKLFDVACRRAGIGCEGPDLSTAAFRRPPKGQLSFFE
jgi:DNA repair photolyase